MNINDSYKAQRKVKQPSTLITANPYALVTNDVVTDVVYMQDYNNQEITETLKKYTYDYYINCSEYGHMIYVDEIVVGDAIVVERPFPSWELDSILGIWLSPVEYPQDGKVYIWDEQILNWNLCLPCEEEPTVDANKEKINAN